MPPQRQAVQRYVQLCLTTATSYFSLVVAGGQGCEVYLDSKLLIFTAALAGSAGADTIKYAHNKGFCVSATLPGVDATHGAATKPFPLAVISNDTKIILKVIYFSPFKIIKTTYMIKYCVSVLFLIIHYNVITAQGNNPEINQLADCQKLVNTGKTQAEKDELQNNYWVLLGIVSDLSNYREMFLQNGKLINLFPTAYYHTTFAEMQNILKLQFTYPIETMKQMIAFYDAYKFNRNLWDNGMKNNVEPHWREHFEYAESISTLLSCPSSGFVLSTAIAAHVQCDLPRAIKYSYDNRYDKTISPKNIEYQQDFLKTNALFEDTKNNTIDDISNALTGCLKSALTGFLNWKSGELQANDLSNEIYEEYTSFCKKIGFKKILTDQDVINLRQSAWNTAFAGKSFTDINGAILLGQSLTDHNPLIAIGKNLCPPTPNFNVALTFINDYVKPFGSNGKKKMSKDTWIETNALLTPTFKAKYKAIIDEARAADPKTLQTLPLQMG